MQRACSRSSLLVACCFAMAVMWCSSFAFADDAPASWVQPHAITPAPASADANAVDGRTYSLVDLLKLALSINPQTREAEEQAYQASLATRLAKSQYAPQVSLKALGGFQRTP